MSKCDGGWFQINRFTYFVGNGGYLLVPEFDVNQLGL